MVQFIREDTLETAAWEMDYHHNPYELACWMHLKDTHFVWPQPVVDSSSPVPF